MSGADMGRTTASKADAVTWTVRLGPYYKYFLLAPLGVLVIGFFAIPLLWLFRVSLFVSRGASGFGIGGAKGQKGGGFYVEDTWTIDNYVNFFAEGYFLDVLTFTVLLAVLVTVVTMALAYPMSYYIYKAGPKLKVTLLVLVILPKLSNILVLVYGLQILLANNGWVNDLMILLQIIDEPVKLVYNLFSVVVCKVLLIIPYTILVITATLHGLDPALRDAADGMGASPARTFLAITLPLSLPGTFVALLITIVWALGAFVSPHLLGNPDLQTLAVEVPKQTFENVNWAMGSAIAFIMLTLMFAVVLTYNWMLSVRMPWRAREA
jgi:ABC-type spermidine/putrescine transport system permease subunit I